MSFMKQNSIRLVVVPAAVLAVLAMLEVVPSRLSAAEPSAAIQIAQQERAGSARGRFVSFQDGVLTIEANDGVLVRNKLPENLQTFVWSDEGGFQLADAAAALSQAKGGTWFQVQIEKENASIRIGSRKSQTVGTFVSYKGNRLLILGKDLGASYTKKYGNQLHFNKFRDDVPAYESIDGGEYQLIGMANKVLADVREGAVVIVHGEGDDNITLVQIGMPKQK